MEAVNRRSIVIDPDFLTDPAIDGRFGGWFEPQKLPPRPCPRGCLSPLVFKMGKQHVVGRFNDDIQSKGMPKDTAIVVKKKDKTLPPPRPPDELRCSRY